MNALVAGNGSYIVRLSVCDLHGPTVTKLIVAGVLLIVHCSYQSAILSNGRYVKVLL